jgi:magnesium chelatase subunit D
VPEPGEQAASRGADIGFAAAIFAVDPCGTGVVLRSGAGPTRENWLAVAQALFPAGTRMRRLPLHISDDRLLGGLDLAATLAAGRPIAERGLLAQADGGVLLIPMAERLPGALAARIASTFERREVQLERDGFAERLSTQFGIVALDEGIEDEEHLPPALLNRLACHVDLVGVSPAEIRMVVDRDCVWRARKLLASIHVDDAAIEALCTTALALGIASANAPFLAVKAARAVAALEGSANASDRHVAIAARLVLAPRATRLPATPDAADERTVEENRGGQPENDGEGQLEEIVLAAAKAAIPPGLLAKLLGGKPRCRRHEPGRAGAPQSATWRGRPVGARRAPPRGGARVNVVETLRAAAPWQTLRQRERIASGGTTRHRLEIRPDDFRIRRFKHKSGNVTIFVVDASGSSALARLAEAKGAVELLLADCYVRRDQVALIAFGGRGTELLLPPTRSLARAKRSLADLPGGGGTPLAAAIDAAAALAQAIRRKGRAAAIVVLTDGRPNLARDGRPGRAGAEQDAVAAANGIRASGFPALLIDTSAMADAAAGRIAEAMGAHYLPLPHADARTLSEAVRARLGEGA